VKSPAEQPSFTCVANAPNITWTFVNSSGVETSLIDYEDGTKYQIISTSDGNSTTESTITFFNLDLAPDDSAIVRCKVSTTSLEITAAASKLQLDGFFIISKHADPILSQ
jgi:hypothetical protein